MINVLRFPSFGGFLRVQGCMIHVVSNRSNMRGVAIRAKRQGWIAYRLAQQARGYERSPKIDQNMSSVRQLSRNISLDLLPQSEIWSAEERSITCMVLKRVTHFFSKRN